MCPNQPWISLRVEPTASARHDYLKRDRLSLRTQLLMWPAYLLGALVILTNTRDAGVSGSRRSILLGGSLGITGLLLFVAGVRPFSSFAELAGRETGGLITGGVYRYSRNPQYVENLLMSAGASIAARSKSAAAVTAVAAVSYATYVPAEECHMERVFGDEYRRYRSRTARWIDPRGRA